MLWINDLNHYVVGFLSKPEYALPVLFMGCIASATVLPLGSEWIVLAYFKINSNINFYQTVLILILATMGNTLGGMINYYMGLHLSTISHHPKLTQLQSSIALPWIKKIGAKLLFFSFLPIIGDILIVLAGWLRLHWLPCLYWQALGKFIRYSTLLIWA